MSHDARYEDSPAYGEETDPRPAYRDVSANPPYGAINRDTAADRDDVVNSEDAADRDDVVNSEDAADRDDVVNSEDAASRDDVVNQDRTTVDGSPVEFPVDAESEPAKDAEGGTPVAVGEVDDAPSAETSTPATTSTSDTTVIPVTPVTVEPVAAESDTSAAAASVAAASAPISSVTGSDVDWRELQGRFVDDPAATVREAGDMIEKEFKALRARSESGSTEDLRIAFRRYRDLYAVFT